jgi:hypothetical protein
MSCSAILPLLIFSLQVLLPKPAEAQAPEFLPEIDTYYVLSPFMRLSFQAKQTREGGDPTQAEIGPTIEFYLKPWIKLRNATRFDLDDANKRALVLSAGYRILPSPDIPPTERMTLIAKTNFSGKWGILISDRNRADLDWTNGAFDWRYRNLFSIEKPLTVRRYHPKVFLRSEEFYESRYGKWSTTALYAGGILPIRQHIIVSPYYVHQNNTGNRPNQQLEQVGLIVDIFLGVQKK